MFLCRRLYPTCSLFAGHVYSHDVTWSEGVWYAELSPVAKSITIPRDTITILLRTCTAMCETLQYICLFPSADLNEPIMHQYCVSLTVENENHCDFVKLREMLIRVNMEDLREQTHTRHYELYRRCKLEEMGFKDTDPDSKPFRY